MTTIHELPLSHLKIDPANVRTGDHKPDPAFIASIREKDVIVPLTVRQNGDGYLVTDGGKRLSALQALAKDGTFSADRMVPVTVRTDSDADAVDTSLTTNYIREQMHPVREYEAFAKLEAGGMTAEQIAKRYNINAKGVKQRLALGRLAPEVRAAWLDDKLDEETATAFTLEPDQKRQAAVLKKLGRNAGRWNVKREILGEASEAGGMLRLVGLEAYKAAGGATTEDLFTHENNPEIIATDLKLLKTLADKKFADTIERLQAEGWKWVSHVDDLPSNAGWWDSKPKGDVKEADRGKYGVIVKQQPNGGLEIKYGVVKPSEKKAAEKKKAVAKGEAPEVGISMALAGRISEQVTRAAATVLMSDAHLAMAAIAAALTCYEGPLCIDHRDGTSGLDDDDNDKVELLDFHAQLATFRKMSAPHLERVLARLAATSLSMGGSVQHQLPLADDRDEDRALLEALDPKKLNAQLRANFDAADYFAGVNAQACKDAIALCDPKQPITGKEEKAEMAKLAADLVKKSNAGGKAGYLPPEMRTAHYDGPKPKAAAKKPTKSKR